MSNSSLVTYRKLTKNYTPRKNSIDAIIIHCYVGQVTAKQGCDYFAVSNNSANYVVGTDGSIGLSVEEKNRAWTSGGYDNRGNPIRVNGISGADWDHRAITIEVASDMTHPYAVTTRAYESLIKLVADICKRNNIKKLLWKGDKSLVGKIAEQNMAVHRWFANKSCPGDYLYERMGDIADKVNAIISPDDVKSSSADTIINVGDVVQFTGTRHYTSSNATNGKACKPGRAKVNAIAKSGKHPVHLIAVTGQGSTVYGWVNAAEIAPVNATLVVGTKVRVNKGAKTFTGGGLASFVYDNVYEVMSIRGDRVIIGIGNQVTAAMNKKDLTAV